MASAARQRAEPSSGDVGARLGEIREAREGATESRECAAVKLACVGLLIRRFVAALREDHKGEAEQRREQ